MTQKPTLVIGDVHGNYDRLTALLEQEGIIEETTPGEYVRINHDVEVVQLGDLGHFGRGNSPTGDMLCYVDGARWLDVILWGNHDRAVISDVHAFGGYEKPRIEIYHLMKSLAAQGKLKLAHEAHGWLITHAGLAGQFARQPVRDILKTDPAAFAEWANHQDKISIFSPGDEEDHLEHVDPNFVAVRDAIGPRRGGRSPVGGILWRDIEERLHMGFPQIFGHSADHKSHKERYCWERGNTRKFGTIPDYIMDKAPDGKLSYCIDIGGKGSHSGDNCLMGIWLPEQRVVRVDLGDN